MNTMELVESYYLGNAGENQVLQLIEWLQEDRENIREFIRETHDYKNLRNFLATKDVLFERKNVRGKLFKAIEGQKKGGAHELSFEGLKHAAGGKVSKANRL